jgi:ribosomal protein S8
MNNKAILNKVKELLGMEVKLEQRKLEDGVTVIEADAFEPDNEVMIVTEDEQMIPLPVGEYVMEGGEQVLVVTEEGLISEIKAKEEEVEEEVVEEEAKKDEEKEEEMAEESRPIKKTVESIVKETFFTEIENLKKENAELKAKLETLSSDENTNEETTVETTNEEVTNEVETTTEEVAEVELSSEEPAAKPISYNPENKENTEKFNFAKNRPRNIMDTVLKRINK